MNNNLKLKNTRNLNLSNTPEFKQTAEDIKKSLSKLENIEAKEKCLRVRFLDWLSDKLLDWSNRVHLMASRINSPCLIEITPRNREDSNHFKDSLIIKQLNVTNEKNNGGNK